MGEHELGALLERVFDIERCEFGGQLKIITAIEELAVIARVLGRLGLSAHSPPRFMARGYAEVIAYGKNGDL